MTRNNESTFCTRDQYLAPRVAFISWLVTFFLEKKYVNSAAAAQSTKNGTEVIPKLIQVSTTVPFCWFLILLWRYFCSRNPVPMYLYWHKKLCSWENIHSHVSIMNPLRKFHSGMWYKHIDVNAEVSDMEKFCFRSECECTVCCDGSRSVECNFLKAKHKSVLNITAHKPLQSLKKSWPAIWIEVPQYLSLHIRM